MRILSCFCAACLVLPVIAATPSEPADPKLRAVYQRLHFSKQYPPEAVELIQINLQNSTEPLRALEELAGNQYAGVRSLTALLISEYGEATGGKTLWILVRDDSDSVRMAAAAGLARLAQQTSFPFSTEPLHDARPEVRGIAAATLNTLADKAAEMALIELLQDDNEMVRMEAARALGPCGTETAVPALVSRLQDRSALVRQSVAATLGQFKTPDAVEFLVKALDDPDWHVRATIIESLSRYSSDPVIRVQVTAAILSRLKSDDYALVRDRAADALAGVPDDKVVDALVDAMLSDVREVRFHAAQAIINGRATGALPKLMENRTNNNPEVRQRIIEVFGKLGGSEQLPAVIEATNDSEPTVQLAAVNALRLLRERGVTANLLPRLNDPNPHVRAAVCRALGDMGDRNVCPKLVPLLRDDSGYVRSAAAEALGKLGDRTSIAPLLQILSGERPVDGGKPEVGLVIAQKQDFLAEISQLSEVQQKARAVEALGELRAPEAVDGIVQHGLKASDPALRAVSAYSLGKIQDAHAVEPLQDAVRPYYNAAPVDLSGVIDTGANKTSDETRRLKEKEARVRASVVWALGQIGDPSARETLLKAVNDQNSLVRDAAVEALAKIAEREERQAATSPKPR